MIAVMFLLMNVFLRIQSQKPIILKIEKADALVPVIQIVLHVKIVQVIIVYHVMMVIRFFTKRNVFLNVLMVIIILTKGVFEVVQFIQKKMKMVESA